MKNRVLKSPWKQPQPRPEPPSKGFEKGSVSVAHKCRARRKKKACDTHQPERVPWAKMATVTKGSVYLYSAILSYKTKTLKTVDQKNEWQKKAEISKWRSRLEKRRLLKREEQIVGTQEKSQQIVAQRLLSCLQYLDATKSSAKDLSQSSINL